MKNNLLKKKRRKTLVGNFKTKDKDMTRKEQIEQASIDYCDGNSFADARIRGAFEMGAYWSDDNPSDKIRRLKFKVTPDVYDTYKRGRKDAIDNPTGGELLNVLQKGREIGYKEAVEKAFNLLETMINEVEYYSDDNTPHFDKDEFIKEIRNIMEEQQ